MIQSEHWLTDGVRAKFLQDLSKKNPRFSKRHRLSPHLSTVK